MRASITALFVLLAGTPGWAAQISLEGLSGTISVEMSADVVADTSSFTNAADIDVDALGGLFDITAFGDEILIEVLTDIPVEGIPLGVGTIRLHFDDWSISPVFPVAVLNFLSWGGNQDRFYIQFSGGGFGALGLEPYEAGDVIHLTLDDTAPRITTDPPTVPEPGSSLLLLSLGLAGTAAVHRAQAPKHNA